MIGSSLYLQERIFPVISANIYKLSDELPELTADRQAACKILAVVEKKLSGWDLNDRGQFRHLLLQHILAMEAELAAKWQRADFFWRQVQIELKALSKRQDVWQELANAVVKIPGVRVMHDPVKLRQRVVNELFIDTHCAFYNGLIAQTTTPSWKDRAFVHIDYIQQLLELSFIAGKSGEEVKTLLGEAWQMRITLCKQGEKWQQAINYCQQRLKYLPNDIEFQCEMVEAQYLGTLAKLKANGKHYRNAKSLQSGIHELEKTLKNYPYNLVNFELLGRLYHLRAVSLSNNDRLAESLVSIQKAIAYHPFLLEAYKTREELMEMMTELQEQMSQLLGKNLNHKGQQLQAEANRGFTAMNAYIDSDEAKETARAFRVAEAVELWHSIGLPEPRNGWAESSAGVMRTPNGKTIPIQSASKSTKMALQLCEAVESVLQHPPHTKAEVPSVWETIVESKPDLAGLNAARICGYLEDSLFEEGGSRVLVTPPTGYTETLPILTPTSIKPRLSTEPFMPWLLSSQDKRIKLQVVVASMLVIITGGVAMQERTTFAGRESAYKTILTAKEVQYDEVVLAASKEFFHNASLFGKDKRTPQVIEIYEESLVRWSLQQPKESLATDNEYVQLYRQLQKTANTEEKQP